MGELSPVTTLALVIDRKSCRKLPHPDLSLENLIREPGWSPLNAIHSIAAPTLARFGAELKLR